jgi:predicted ABC-type ATPase
VADPRPFCLCIAGPNGSGKTTLTRRLRKDHDLGHWIDPDEVALGLAAGEKLSDKTSRDAFIRARNRRLHYAAHRADFGFETVFSHGSNVAFLKALKALGYAVQLYFVCTDNPQINVARVANRVARGEHDVAKEKIVARYPRSLACLALALPVCDRVFLFDNSDLLTVTDEAGRLVGEIRTVGDDLHHAEIQLFPTIPQWAAEWALAPYVATWRSTPMAKAVDSMAAGADLEFSHSLDLRTQAGRRSLLRQFYLKVR